MAELQIVIIHDDWNENSPLVEEMKEKYGSENVTFIKHSQQGIDYLMKAPVRKTVVILDYNFKKGEPTGGTVFQKIREKSALIYVIIVTRSQYNSIAADDLVQFVNNHALAIARPSDDYTVISQLVETATHELALRADVILEEWISERPEDERTKPYLALYDGKVYSLNDILNNIRTQSELGINFTKNVLGLAVDLVMKKMGQKDV